MESSMIGSSIRSVSLACAVVLLNQRSSSPLMKMARLTEAKAMWQVGVAALKVNEETGFVGSLRLLATSSFKVNDSYAFA